MFPLKIWIYHPLGNPGLHPGWHIAPFQPSHQHMSARMPSLVLDHLAGRSWAPTCPSWCRWGPPPDSSRSGLQAPPVWRLGTESSRGGGWVLAGFSQCFSWGAPGWPGPSGVHFFGLGPGRGIFLLAEGISNIWDHFGLAYVGAGHPTS